MGPKIWWEELQQGHWNTYKKVDGVLFLNSYLPALLNYSFFLTFSSSLASDHHQALPQGWKSLFFLHAMMYKCTLAKCSFLLVEVRRLLSSMKSQKLSIVWSCDLEKMYLLTQLPTGHWPLCRSQGFQWFLCKLIVLRVDLPLDICQLKEVILTAMWEGWFCTVSTVA